MLTLGVNGTLFRTDSTEFRFFKIIKLQVFTVEVENEIRMKKAIIVAISNWNADLNCYTLLDYFANWTHSESITKAMHQ